MIHKGPPRPEPPPSPITANRTTGIRGGALISPHGTGSKRFPKADNFCNTWPIAVPSAGTASTRGESMVTARGRMATDNLRFTTVRRSFARIHPTLLVLKPRGSLVCVCGQATRPGPIHDTAHERSACVPSGLATDQRRSYMAQVRWLDPDLSQPWRGNGVQGVGAVRAG